MKIVIFCDVTIVKTAESSESDTESLCRAANPPIGVTYNSPRCQLSSVNFSAVRAAGGGGKLKEQIHDRIFVGYTSVLLVSRRHRLCPPTVKGTVILNIFSLKSGPNGCIDNRPSTD